MRGIISAAGYLPHHRLDRAKIKDFFGSGGGKGTRTVASYDEDTTTLAVEAGRLALRDAGPAATPDALWFASASPTYLDKNNASIVHAALRLPRDAAAFDLGGAVRSGVGALRSALRSTEPCVIVTAADIRTGNPTSPDEANGGDAGSALVIGDDTAGPVIAELIGAGSATREFLDTWKAPGESGVRHWEERFAETQYAPLVADAWTAACKDAGLAAEDVDLLVVSGAHARAVQSTTRKLGAVGQGRRRGPGRPRSARSAPRTPAFASPPPWKPPSPARSSPSSSLADGADVLVFRATDAIAGLAARPPDRRPGRRRQPRPALRQVPVVAGRGHRAAAQPPAPGPPLGVGRRAQRGMEVRLRRLA